MSQSLDLLDLSIMLTLPPQGSAPENIASIALRCDPLGLSHTGDLLTDPLTQKKRNELHWYLEEYWKWPYYEFAQRGKQIEALLPEVGRRLYRTVFGSFDAMSILQAWRLQPGEQRQISIMSDIPRVLSLPWELLHDEQGFLALRTRHPVSIVRRLPQRELAELAVPFEPPLRVLLVTARPEGTGFIDPRNIASELIDEVQSQVEAGVIALEFLRPPTLAAMRTRLKNTAHPVHILHFDGHGIFEGEIDPQDGLRRSDGGQGKLAFEDADGKLDLVEADVLAQVLQDTGVKLAVLDACQSAMGAADDAFSSVAARLIQGGVDTVIAMSASVLVTSSTRFFEAFYRELVAGTPAPIAQERARQALHDDPHRHLQRRRKDEEGQPVELRDWWLPHFFQQRPLVLQSTKPTKPTRKSRKQQPSIPTPRLSEDMATEPRYGFSGRAYELLQLERYLLRKKLVVISGFGGIGKTALAREAADWLTRTSMYMGACFVSFEHGGDFATLLRTLGNYLGIYDGHYNPNDKTAALERLKPLLKQRPTVVIADNLESILPGGEAPLEAATRTQLWDVLLELSYMGTGVLLTTLSTNFGDGRMVLGDKVAYLELGGLRSEDAYDLASHLLNSLGIDRKRAPYADLRDLLAQLDHHPLAIQLVLPALRTIPLVTILADFTSLLPRFVDDTVTGRNRSLLASLEYSLQRLSTEQRSLLSRLAPFEGGAMEAELLAITEISQIEWAELRTALEPAGLLTAAQVHATIAIPFLHFHPVLTPYLRSQQGADDVALRQRYTQRYYALANDLYNEDRRHPKAIRSLVLKELPNLRRALELLLEAGELDTASEMADRIITFLNEFGLTRERDELRRRVMAASMGAQKSDALTKAEYLQESGLGEDELGRGEILAAHTRFTNLLARIEILPEGTPLGRGSYEHCSSLRWLSYCLISGGQHDEAEKYVRKALLAIEALIKPQPKNQLFLSGRVVLLSDLGNVLFRQGKYVQAQEAYEDTLEKKKQLGDLRGQAVTLGQLGSVAEKRRDYTKARDLHLAALHIFHELNAPAMEAVAWHQLGRVAQEQNEWTEAEHCYLESLKLDELYDNTVSAAGTMDDLAIVVIFAGRPVEAESWFKRAIAVHEQIHPGGSLHAKGLSNLAALLLKEVQAGNTPVTRLTEAQSYAKQALKIQETLDASSSIWLTLGTLARITELQGQTKAAQDYRHRERETFAAFAGNRYLIDSQYRQLIVDLAAVAKGDTEAQVRSEAVMPQMRAENKALANAIERIWAGERDWHSLVEGLDLSWSLLVLLVLETIVQP